MKYTIVTQKAKNIIQDYLYEIHLNRVLTNSNKK